MNEKSKKIKTILFISSNNLSTTPRLLKELKYAVNAGYKCSFVGFHLGNWSQRLDNETLKSMKINAHYIPAHRTGIIKWIMISLVEKLSQMLSIVFPNNIKICSYAHSKRSFLLNKYLKNKKYDLIVAHTLATFYPACTLSEHTNTPFVLDVEDYHPGESCSGKEKCRREIIMQKTLPKANFVTYASPLIGQKTLELCSNAIKKHTLINNCFAQTEFCYNPVMSGKVKFVWFSQNIAQGRGLELILPALWEFRSNVELNLTGNLYPDFYKQYLHKYSDIITIHKPLLQHDLNIMLGDFDIGLAIEPHKDINNKIALSNKIWAYLQSGLYILATDTPAQSNFLSEHKHSGIICKAEYQYFYNSIKSILENIDRIRAAKQSRYDYGRQFSWDKENSKLDKIYKLMRE